MILKVAFDAHSYPTLKSRKELKSSWLIPAKQKQSGNSKIVNGGETAPERLTRY